MACFYPEIWPKPILKSVFRGVFLLSFLALFLFPEFSKLWNFLVGAICQCGIIPCTSNLPKILLIDGDSVSSDLYILECCFQLGDLYVQNVFCVINERFKPTEVWCETFWENYSFFFLTRTRALSARNVRDWCWTVKACGSLLSLFFVDLLIWICYWSWLTVITTET